MTGEGREIPIRAAKTCIADGGRLAKVEDFRALDEQVGGIIFRATGGSGKGAR